MNKILTILQAKEQGYEHWIYPLDGFQSIRDIDDLEPMHFLKGEIHLIEKEPYNPPGLSSKDISEWLAETIAHNHSEDSGDDTDSVYDTLKDIDCSELVGRIDEKLKTLNYYRSTGIILTQ